MRDNKVYIPASSYLAAIKEDTKIDEDAVEEYNKIKNGKYDWVELDYQKKTNTEDIDTKLWSDSTKTFLDRLGKEVYNEYKVTIPAVETETKFEFKFNKDQFINEACNLTEYTLRRMPKVARVFLESYKDILESFGGEVNLSNEDIDDKLSMLPKDDADVKNAVSTMRTYLTGVLKDYNFNVEYSLNKVDAQEPTYLSVAKINIVNKGNKADIKVSHAFKEQAELKFDTIKGKIYKAEV